MRILSGLVIVGAAAVGIAGAGYWLSSSSSSQVTAAANAPQVSAKGAPTPAPTAVAASAPQRVASASDDITASVQPKPAPAPKPVQKAMPCANPDALGISRVVEVDTTGGPGFGFEHFKQLDFLQDKEVVLTFDDGPWPHTTPSILRTLANECTTGIFFSVGKHATYHPEILRQVAAAGHTVGGHTWSHINLNGKKVTEQQAREEIEKGISAVRMALGANPAPFFRFPQLQHNKAMVSYLGDRNVAMFSCDLDSFDFKSKSAEQIIQTVMTKLDKQGKGIVLMHDLQKRTAEALPELLRRMKAGGYKVVQMKAKATWQTLPEYDAMVTSETKLPTLATTNTRPVSAVVQTVSQ